LRKQAPTARSSAQYSAIATNRDLFTVYSAMPALMIFNIGVFNEEQPEK
jgi:hypothetical protein